MSMGQQPVSFLPPALSLCPQLRGIKPETAPLWAVAPRPSSQHCACFQELARDHVVSRHCPHTGFFSSILYHLGSTCSGWVSTFKQKPF